MAKAIYSNTPLALGDLLKDVRNGRIGLPDLQRPFVWKDAKVRDLFDSMIKGFPIGYILLWESPSDYDEKKTTIGANEKSFHAPKDLVIDGQQRLTALVASMYGITVKDKNYKNRRIRIAFKPLTKEFAVWTKAIDNSAEYIPDISQLFIAKEKSQSSAERRAFIKRLNESRVKQQKPELSDEEQDLIEERIIELLQLESYQMPTLEINRESNEEDVADIFVRVNSAGQKLTENDFILTLVSVYEKERRDQINEFCEASRIPADRTAYNHIMSIDPSHIIRMTVGVGFRRARLRYAYMILRGKDLETGITSQTVRMKNMTIFKEALDKVLDLNNWHDYLNILKSAGYISDKLIASTNAVVFSYVLYLIAKYDYGMKNQQLRKMIRRWFFMATVTAFYTGSTETDVEKQFTDMRDIHDRDALEGYIDRVIASRFTDDYFNIQLPIELETAAPITPTWNCFIASQIVLGHSMLFGTTPISNVFGVGSSGTKAALDRHHIFPKKYLFDQGIENNRDRNQIANFTYLDYQTNISVSDESPAVYVEYFRNQLSAADFKKSCEQHALPDGFETMEYFSFLKERRKLMAQLIREAFNRLN